MWADASHSTSWPGCTSARTASTFDIDPVGMNSAASCPNSPATRSSSAATVGSSPYTSSPTSAAAIAARIASVGLVRVSERRSITGPSSAWQRSAHARRSISATRNASSRDCTRFRRGSQTDS